MGETQLGGTVDFRNETGLRCIIHIPADLFEERV
jgi:hypothetical protein